jgi:hypothetical protein
LVFPLIVNGVDGPGILMYTHPPFEGELLLEKVEPVIVNADVADDPAEAKMLIAPPYLLL